MNDYYDVYSRMRERLRVLIDEKEYEAANEALTEAKMFLSECASVSRSKKNTVPSYLLESMQTGIRTLQRRLLSEYEPNKNENEENDDEDGWGEEEDIEESSDQKTVKNAEVCEKIDSFLSEINSENVVISKAESTFANVCSIKNSNIVIKEHNFSGLIFSEMENTNVVIGGGAVSGPVAVRDCSKCKFNFSSRQVRVRNCRDTQFYVSFSEGDNAPFVLEDCANINIYPRFDFFDADKVLFEKEGTIKKSQVVDFNQNLFGEVSKNGSFEVFGTPDIEGGEIRDGKVVFY